MNAEEKCLFINSQIPKGGLFTGEKKTLHPDSNVTWRISPEPFWILQEHLDWLEELGPHLLRFYKACNLALLAERTRHSAGLGRSVS